MGYKIALSDFLNVEDLRNLEIFSYLWFWQKITPNFQIKKRIYVLEIRMVFKECM